MASSIRARARASAGTRRQYTNTTHHAPAPDTKIIIAATCCCILISFASAFSPPASGRGSGAAVIISRGIISSSSLETNSAKPPVAIKTSTSTQLYNKLGKDFDKSDLFPRDDFDKDEFLDDDDDDNDDGIDYSQFDPAVAAQLRKAKQLLKESKKKVKEQAEARAKAAEEADIPGGVSQESPEKEGINTADAVLPFFASTSSQKIKSTTESGEIIADGETMANLSKSEAWEKRPLSQMFDKEARTDYDGNLVDDEINKNLLAEREIGIYNLRKALQNEDFRKVFDKRNRFIGDL